MSSDAPRKGPHSVHIGAMVALFLVITLAAAAYLSDPIERHLVVPNGPDTPAHLWRAKLVSATDLGALFDSSSQTFQVNPDRVGLPVLASFLSGLGVTPWRFMFIIPALAAGLLAAAGWALASAAGEPRWAAPFYSIALVGSVPFALTTRSYLDNALADGLIVAAASGLLLIAGGAGGGIFTAVVLVGAILMHWPVGIVFWAIALLFGAFLIPSARRREPHLEPWWSTPPARVFGAAGAAIIAGGIVLLLTPGANLPDRGTGQFFEGNVHRLLGYYRFPALLGVAGLAAGLVRRRERQVRPVVLLLGAWLLPSAAATVAYLLGVGLPLMRFLGMTLAIPLLAALLLTSLMSASAKGRSTGWREVLVVVATAIAVATTGAMALFGRDLARDAKPSITAEELETIRPALAYAAEVDAKALVAIVSKDPGRAYRRLRMLAPAPLIPRIGVFQGTPDELSRRVASREGTEVPAGLTGTDLKNAMIAADAVRLMRGESAIAVGLRPYLTHPRSFGSQPGIGAVADGVYLVGQPRAPEPAVPALEPPGPDLLIRDTIVAFLSLLVIGLGWSWVLVPAPLDRRVALAPEIGVAIALPVGTILGLLGVPLGGAAGVATLAFLASLGGTFALWRHVRSRGQG